MLERIREGSQGIVAKSILGLVILTFAISGIGSYISSQADIAAATVNGVEIGQAQLEQEYENIRRREASQYGQFFDQLASNEAYINSLRQRALEGLIVQELQRQQSVEMGIRVSDEQVKDRIRNMPEFQQDGQFSNDIYIARLRQASFQPNQFRDYMREQMARTQYIGAVVGSEFALPSETERFGTLDSQTRSFDLVTFKASELEKDVELADSDLDDFYQMNLTRYMTQEKVAVEYLVLDQDAMAKDVQVSDEELQAYYDDNSAEFSQPERRRFSHILIEAGDDAAAKIAEVKAKLDAGEDFAEVAKAHSDDTFSAENGGDLEWLERGVMDEAFDNAAFALANTGDITGAVESEFGTHFIKMTEFEAQLLSPFAEVKADILETIKTDKSNEIYLSAQTTATELAFEFADTLADTANEVKLELGQTALVSRFAVPAEINFPAVTQQIFDAEFVAEGLNSELIEVNETKSVFVRVTEHEDARQQSLDEVKAAVTTAVTQQKARELAEEKANEVLAQVESGGSLKLAAEAAGLTVVRFDNTERSNTEVDPAVRDKLFALAKPAEGQSEAALVTLRSGDAAVIALDAIGAKEAVAENNDQRVAGLLVELNGMALVNASKEVAEIEN